MAHNYIDIFDVFSKHLGSLTGDKLMGSPVESIAADSVFIVILSRDSIEKCLFRHRLMECGIKYSSHRFVLHEFPAGLNSDQSRRVMERCEYVARLDLF